MMYFILISFMLIFSMVINNKHLLMILLTLESLMIFFLFNFFISWEIMNMYMYLIFITLSACEGALGLSILISVSRAFGSDYLSMFNSV